MKPAGPTGTILELTNLRSDWTRKKLLALRRELTKLINPFSDVSKQFTIELFAPAERDEDEKRQRTLGTSERKEASELPLVNGKIQNTILDVLEARTTSIHIRIIEEGAVIESKLDDRGELIYRIRENNSYCGLKNSELDVAIYFLNRGAKHLFARRMGLPSVQFGSIFLFRNGFRIFPIGQEDDDFFGLSRRKQQGMRRFLGSRDLIGRVEILGVEGFDEATSRDQGLIRTPQVEDLIKCVIEKCIRRLERYVVDITWKDQFDKDVSDTSRMRLDESSILITQLVSRLAATRGVELVEYNPELVRILDEKSSAFKGSLRALEVLAEKTGDSALLARVDEATDQVVALQAAEAEAREAERRAEAKAAEAEGAASLAQARYSDERERNQFLVAAASLDQDTILNLHHQIIMHASDVHIGVRRMMGKLRTGASIRKDEWIDFLERVSFRNSQILTASRFATKGGYKQQSVKQEADLAVYICDYITTVSSLWAPRGIEIDVSHDGKRLERSFRPIEIGIVIDNLISNAAKARATIIAFVMEVVKETNPTLLVTVADNGIGWPPSLDPIDRAFEKGITTTDGSGLGLYHLKKVIEGLGGVVEAKQEPILPEAHWCAIEVADPFMKLEFTLLVVDDEPDGVGSAIDILDDHLKAKGFSLKQEVARDFFSNLGLKKLSKKKGRNYDLVMVDYKLGQDDRDGALVALELRQALPYVDMVFYSSGPVSDLWRELFDKKVSGVFIEARQDLDRALTGLADTVIGKAVDLNHMRGIAMAEVAEMDVLMSQTLEQIFQSNDEQIKDAREGTVKKLRKQMHRNSNRLRERLDNGGALAVVKDSLLFTLVNKYRVIRRVAKYCQKELGDEWGVFQSYEKDIIQNRNMLAHASEDDSNNEKTVLRSMGSNKEEVIIDENWMSDFRQKLQRHRAALDTICQVLEGRFGGTETLSDADECSS